ncbi:glycosyltransferase family 1 protein [bacterium]|nr:glycosyltransferase family 1 protein [bacterium]MCP5462252.1 glycosyltransferase family 1 protein [bacterium]
MNITILTLGTRGDIVPFVALACALKKDHSVTIVTNSNFESFITGKGIKFAPLSFDFRQFLNSPEGKKIIEGNVIQNLKSIKTTFRPLIKSILDDAWNASQDSDMLIYHPVILAGSHIAERLDIPAVMATYWPFITPTREFPIPYFPNLNLGGFLNWCSYYLLVFQMLPYQNIINTWREKSLGLPPRSVFKTNPICGGHPIYNLYFYSPHVIPTPKDWPPTAFATGYWFLKNDETWQPPLELTDFLNAGEPPIYVCFGSMTSRNAEKLTRCIVSALKKTNQRGIIASGWGGLQDCDKYSETFFAVDEVPYDWLFPKVKALIHHGGSGTLAYGLRSGKPSIVCPFFSDQPFWGETIKKIGVGPPPIRQKDLSEEKLISAINEILRNPEYTAKATDLGEKIRSENGLDRAVQFISQTFC